tara:strand:- start:1008 stop:1241 length:234 start_codon:yes stop_codon:yes gene_type:complete
MIALLTPNQIQELEELHIDPRDIEIDIVYNSKTSNINLPECFKEQIFKLMYGVNINQVAFVDNNNMNWNINNIIFRV